VSTLGQALETARRAKGISQKDLATAVGVTQEAVSRYEGERRIPQPEVLERLADALGVTPEFLTSVDKVRAAWAIDAHLRRRATAQAGVWKIWEARLNMLRNHARYLYEEIDIRTEHVVPLFDSAFVEPEDAARMTRMQWRIPIGPIRSLIGWLEGAGCLVVERDFQTERVDGLSQWVDDHPILLINSNVPTDRKRLTIAHELGHLILHTHDVGEDIERDANRFAAEFMMPAEVIRPQLRNITLGKLLDLKRVWGVSMQALVERALHLKMLTPERRTVLYKQLSARSWRKHEPASEELAPEQPRLTVQIGQALVDRGLKPLDIARLTGFSQPSADNPFLLPQRRLRRID
jgi:Zn-dependent peptidase ImmA (M78 family)/transcriptional regulator with XRE-family HTH domain